MRIRWPILPRNGRRRPWTPLRRSALRVAVNAVAILVAAQVIPGVVLRGWGSAAVGGLVLGLVHAWVRPALYFLTFPITVGTLGLFLYVLDAACLWLTAHLTPGFDLDGVMATGLASLLVWALNRAVTVVVGDDRELILRSRRRPPPRTR